MIEAGDRYFRKFLRCIQCRKDAEMRADCAVLAASLCGLVASYVLIRRNGDWTKSESLGFVIFVLLVVTTICIPRLRSLMRRVRQIRIVRHLFDEIRQSSMGADEEPERWNAIERLRRAAEPLPKWAVKNLSCVYRVYVARVVDSMRLTGTEIDRLDRTAAALGLAKMAEVAARTCGFLDVFQRAVGNRMDAEQERVFNHIRIGLDIETSVVEPVRRRQTELIEARQIGYADLDPIPSPVRLKERERCYCRAVAAEVLPPQHRNSRESVGKELGSGVRIGDLLITSSRVLFLSIGAIGLSYDAIVSVDVDAEKNLVILSTDERDDAVVFCVEKPFVVQAFIDRLGYTASAQLARA